MLLSDRLLNGDFQAGFVAFSDMYHYDVVSDNTRLMEQHATKLSDEIKKLEDENLYLREKLKSIHDKAIAIDLHATRVQQLLEKLK